MGACSSKPNATDGVRLVENDHSRAESYHNADEVFDSADLNGKSDPCITVSGRTQATCSNVSHHQIRPGACVADVVMVSGEHEVKSTVRPKTVNPVWNEDFEMHGTLQEFMSHGLHVQVFDCDV